MERKLVPVEPDDSMIEAGEEEIEQRRSMGMTIHASDIYEAMLKAAPEGVPENPRQRMYFPIIMPVDAQGHGPASVEDAVKITFEVWDHYLTSYGSYEYLLDAIEKAEELNREYHIKGITKDHQHPPRA